MRIRSGPDGIFRGDLKSVNLCRQWLRVFYLSDIVTGDGRYIQLSVWNGDAPLSPQSNLGWPIKSCRPSASHWSIWRRSLQLLCTQQPRALRQPLGPWTYPASSTQEWFHDVDSDRIYRRSTGITVYGRIPHRRLRRTCYQPTDIVANCIPPSAVRTTVINSTPTHIIHTGSRPTATDTRPPPQVDAWATRSVVLPPDLRPLFDSLLAGTAVAVCDGSFKANMGSAAFCIQGPVTSSRILGCNLTPGDSSCLSAYRSELGGIYGVVKQVHDLVHQAEITSGGITIGCDCLPALTTVFETETDSPSQSDFDLIHDIRQYISQSPLRWTAHTGASG